MDKFLGQDIPEKERWQFLKDNADAIEMIGYTHRFNPDELAQKKESLAEVSITINDIEIEKKEAMEEFKERLKPFEMVFREGIAPVALDPKAPERVFFEGTIDAPFRWLEKRVELINQKASNIAVSRNNMSMLLTIDETNYYRTQINGVLCFSKEMLEFGINTGKEWEPIKLSQFFKMHRAFFKDKSENMLLVSTLKNFKAKVNQDIERSKEENGSKVDNYSQVVDSNLPKSFKLNIPLFKGFACEEIEVEIYADVDGRDVSLSLVSAGANEAIEEYKNKVIDEQIEAIKGIAPEIVVIDV